MSRAARVTLGLVGLAFLGASPAPAQTDLERVRQSQALLGQVDSLLSLTTEFGALEAIQRSRRALALLNRPGLIQVSGRFYANIALAFTQLGLRDSAIYYDHRAWPFLKSRADTVALAGVHQNLAAVYLRLSQGDSAVANARAGLVLARDPMQKTGLTLALGLGYGYLSMPDSLRAVLHRAIDQGSRSGDPLQAGLVATAYRFLARSWMGDAGGHGDSALVFLRAAEATVARTGVAVHLPSLDGEFAAFFRVAGVLDSAAFYAYRALGTIRAGNDDGSAVMVLRYLAAIWAQSTGYANLDSALAYSRLALEVARRTRSPTEADVLADLGGFLARDHKDSAIAVLRQAREMYRRTGATEHLADVEFYLGLAYVTPERHDSALFYLNSALDRMKMAKRADVYQAETAIAMAEYLAGRFDQVARRMASAMAARATLRRGTGQDFLRIAYGENAAWVYDELWTQAWLRQAPTVGAESAAFASIAVTDRMRAQALNDMLVDPSQATADTADFPGRGRHLLQAALSPDELLLYYRLGVDTLTIWFARKTGPPTVLRVAAPFDSLAPTINSYLLALGVRLSSRLTSRGAALERGVVGARPAFAGGTLEILSKRLSGWLFPAALRPALTGVRNLVIVPYGTLAVLPFGALPDPDGGAPIGISRSIRFAPSLASLEAARAKPVPWSTRGELSKAALVVGNPVMPSVRNILGQAQPLTQLPGAELESIAVGERMGLQPLTGQGASESIIRRRMPTAPVVHLATHGFAYSGEGDAVRSFVALAADSLNDGLLTMGEVANDPSLKLAADLVVLSACETGLGNLRTAEGTVGLQRAFLARGARSVLVSLWNVSDEATRLLMTKFYQHWLDDADHPGKAEALRRAQDEVRKAKGFEHPRFWAAFQLVGAN